MKILALSATLALFALAAPVATFASAAPQNAGSQQMAQPQTAQPPGAQPSYHSGQMSSHSMRSKHSWAARRHEKRVKCIRKARAKKLKGAARKRFITRCEKM